MGVNVLVGTIGEIGMVNKEKEQMIASENLLTKPLRLVGEHVPFLFSVWLVFFITRARRERTQLLLPSIVDYIVWKRKPISTRTSS